MVLDVDFDTDEQSILENNFSAYLCTNEELGTSALDTNTSRATLDLTGLHAETEYAWYAVVTNTNTGYLKTGIYDFTTNKASGNTPGNGSGNTGNTPDNGSGNTGNTPDNGGGNTGNTPDN